MATKTLSNDFMQRIADEGAWKELSSDLNWTEALLEKFQDKIDWQELSENRNILWTIPMLQKFKHRINWDKLSRYADEKVLTENCIETFKEKWNWNELSSNSVITNELLDKFADKWDWEEIIDRYLHVLTWLLRRQIGLGWAKQSRRVFGNSSSYRPS